MNHIWWFWWYIQWFWWSIPWPYEQEYWNYSLCVTPEAFWLCYQDNLDSVADFDILPNDLDAVSGPLGPRHTEAYPTDYTELEKNFIWALKEVKRTLKYTTQFGILHPSSHLHKNKNHPIHWPTSVIEMRTIPLIWSSVIHLHIRMEWRQHIYFWFVYPNYLMLIQKIISHQIHSLGASKIEYMCVVPLKSLLQIMLQCIMVRNLLSIYVRLLWDYGIVKPNINIRTMLKEDIRWNDTSIRSLITLDHQKILGCIACFWSSFSWIILLTWVLRMEQNHQSLWLHLSLVILALFCISTFWQSVQYYWMLLRSLSLENQQNYVVGGLMLLVTAWFCMIRVTFVDDLGGTLEIWPFL